MAISLIEAALAAALIKLHRGSLQAASWTYLAGIWLFATVVIAQNGGIRSVVLSLYVTLPVSAAWLLGNRASLWTTGVCLASALVFAVLEMAGVRLPRTIPGTAIGLWIQLTGAVLMSVIPLTQVLRRLNEALTKVREQFENLQRQDDKLRESEERFRAVADTAPVMIVVTDRDKSASFVNKAWLEFRRRSTEEELGHGWTEGLHPDDRAAALENQSQFGGGGSFKFECRVRREDGEYRWLLCSAVARLEPSGSLAGYIGSAIDITDVKRTQEEALARQKLETLGTLASGIAHDFNNLLGGVMAQAELAQSELAAGSPPEEELKAIRDLVIRGSGIVRELMIYAGKESPVLELVDVSQMIEESLPLLKALVSKHARLEANLAKNIPAVRANVAELRRIIMNLVTNASDAIGDRDGVIRLRTEQLRLTGVAATANGLAEGDYLQLAVSDTGCGIPLESQARVFDPFFTTKSAGRGLGLAVVNGIARGLGGAVHFESEPGKGTTFEVLLPRAEGLAESGQRPILHAERPVGLFRQTTILVVEDEDPLRQAVSKMLRKAGFFVIEASDGSAALTSIRAHDGPIDTLLLDITLPGAPSREVFEEAKRLRPEMRVIITSAYSEDVAAEKLHAKPDGFVRKPYQLERLVDLVRQGLS